jgi:hypothetical protein
MIEIRCAENFRRGGILHPKGVAFYPEDFFTSENLALIKAEPKLMVQTGLVPKGPETASMDELKTALKECGIEFNPTDPRELLVSRLLAAEAQAKAAEADKPKKTKGGAAE